MSRISFVLAALLLSACSASKSKPPAARDLGGASDMTTSTTDASQILARPYGLDVPSGYDPTKPTALILLLHGYSVTGAIQDGYFGFMQLANTHNVFVAHPDGTPDHTGARFWNATDACCDLDNLPVDDVRYLNAVVDDVEARYNIDPKRVWAVGHSNGGFMSHRLACDSASRFSAIVALAGDNWKDPSKCNPSAPVAVLQVHGDADATIPYAGNTTMPSAADSVGSWATKNGCTGTLAATGVTLDLDSGLPGAETAAAAYTCAQGAAELWTIHGGAHAPALIVPDWGNHVYDWLAAHVRP
jgi:polyhydroxybutyrate depolymerase